VLLIDEVLAVGDEGFTRKCLDKISEFRRRGKTVLIVSHSLHLVEKMCDDVLWLRHGKTIEQGDPKRVVDAYLIHVAGGEEALLAREHGQTAAPQGAAPEAPPGAAEQSPKAYREGRWGSREIEIREVRFEDAGGRARHLYVPGERLSVVMRVHAASRVEDFVFGVGFFTADGVSVYGTNTDVEDYTATAIEGDAEIRFTIDDLRLVEGSYLLDVAAHRKDGTPYDYHRGLYSFRVKSRVKDVGVYRPTHGWSFTDAVAIEPPDPRPELDLSEDP
jgi:hypothetical protein